MQVTPTINNISGKIKTGKGHNKICQETAPNVNVID